MAAELTDEQYRAIYAWIDAIPLSRPKKNISRDFSDGVLLAEVIAVYLPQLVETHNYPPANSLKQKIYNYETLNKRVLKKLGYQIPKPVIEDVANAKPGAIEVVLNAVQIKMAKYRERKAAGEVSGSDSVGLQGGISPPHYQAPLQKVSPTGAASQFAQHQQQQFHQPLPQLQQQQQQQQQPVRGGRYTSASGRESGAVAGVDQEILFEKEQQIRELQETVEILELKIAKLEQLVRLKDNKIQKLSGK